jgi:hypothetical protein
MIIGFILFVVRTEFLSTFYTIFGFEGLMIHHYTSRKEQNNILLRRCVLKTEHTEPKFIL